MHRRSGLYLVCILVDVILLRLVGFLITNCGISVVERSLCYSYGAMIAYTHAHVDRITALDPATCSKQVTSLSRQITLTIPQTVLFDYAVPLRSTLKMSR